MADNDSARLIEVPGTDWVMILELAGEIDMAVAPDLDARFTEVATRRISTVIVDASKVTFMDSSGIRALVDGKAVIGSDEGEVRAEGAVILVPSAQVRQVIELMSLQPLFAALCDDLDDALAAVRGGRGDPAEAAR